MNKYLHRALLVLAITTLSACTVLPEAEEIQIYHLPMSSVSADSSAEALDTTLSVAEPSTLRALNTSRISTFSGAQVQRYYAGARWADRGPVLVKQHLLQSLQSSGLFAQVVSAESNLPADYMIHSELRAFQIEASDAGENARVALHVTLVRRLDRQVLGSTLITQEVAVTGSSMRDTTAALGEASDHVNRELATWIYERLKRS
ncbi:ABC-type transport auxiliary lipoprotein family protein [Aliidiomarina sp. Khilg15.8]